MNNSPACWFRRPWQSDACVRAHRAWSAVTTGGRSGRATTERLTVAGSDAEGFPPDIGCGRADGGYVWMSLPRERHSTRIASPTATLPDRVTSA